MKSLNQVLMDSLEDRLREVLATARELVEQVEKYARQETSRAMLLNAKDQMKRVLKE